VQNFTLIGVTVDEISVPGQIDRYKDLISDRTHTGVAFAG